MVGPSVSLLLLFLALAWSVIVRAGVDPPVWDVTLLIVGCVALFYWLLTRRIHRAPPPNPWLRWSIFLLSCYLIFQLLPLPLSVLRVLSPARADLLTAMTPIIGGITWAPISVNAPAALLGAATIFGYTATFLLVRELAWRSASRPWTTAIPLVAIVTFEALIGMFQVLTGVPYANGTYASNDHYAGLLEMVLAFPFLYGLAILRRSRGSSDSRVLPAVAVCGLWAVAALILLAIMNSLSRMGFLVALSVLFFAAALSIGPRLPSRAWRWSSLSVIGAVIILMLIFFPPEQLIARFAELSSTEKISGNMRTLFWKETLPLISEFRLFGCGLGGFGPAFTKYQVAAANFSVDFAHNDYLQYVAELGFVGFAILAAVLIGILVQIFRGIIALGNEDRRLIAIACAAAFVAILLHSLVDFNMYVPADAMTLAWIGGIGSANSLD
jgi:O-antigen ligase